MWNPFKKAREKREAEAKRKAEAEAAKLAAQLRRVNDEIAAARTRTAFPNAKPLSVVPNDLTAQRAYRQDMQLRARAENRTSGYGGDAGEAYQTQVLLNSLQTGSTDSYSPPPSCSSSSDSGSSSSSSMDCGSSDSGGSCGSCD